jgi:zinc/manganese transport system substrate-binding protein
VKTVWAVLGCVICTGALLGVGAATSATSGGTSAGSKRVLEVVAGENFWGSLAAQLGGDRVHVTSIVSDPNADPHDYESSPVDARLFATADYVVLNGAGYDDWASRLLAAQPRAGRKVFTVATLLGKKDGDNPHFWYDPAYVFDVINHITADYKTIDPRQSSYFTSRYETVQRDLAQYKQQLVNIQQHFARTAVAATESIFQYLAQYLHLDLVTPYAFMKAVAEGNDPPTSSEATFEKQIQARAFKVLVYNVQTVTPLTTSIRQQARQKNIPVVGVSETIEPPTATFEEWMNAQLDLLTHALEAQAVGR